jgi:hypothetical protein
LLEAGEADKAQEGQARALEVIVVTFQGRYLVAARVQRVFLMQRKEIIQLL